jgi:hypothetical protein
MGCLGQISPHALSPQENQTVLPAKQLYNEQEQRDFEDEDIFVERTVNTDDDRSRLSVAVLRQNGTETA